MDAIIARGDLGEAAPAAADLEQALARLQLEPVEQQAELALLRRLERLVGEIGSAKIALE